MPTTIVQASVGAGKTEAALQRLIETIGANDDPFARAWVLLATKRQEFSFRQRLIDFYPERQVYFNAEFFNFYTLNARLLNFAGQPQRRISDAAQLGLLRMVIQQLLADAELPTFAPIARTTGFLRIVVDLIVELKQNLVRPDVYARGAQTAKDTELARIYQAYQHILQANKLVDTEGEGWLALETVQTNPAVPPRVDLLLVDGFDQFTPVQARLLAALSEKVGEVYITVTQPPDTNLVSGRFAQALDRLKEAHDSAGASLRRVTLEREIEKKADDLLALGRYIISDVPPVPASTGVELIEAPDEASEVAAVLRDVKRHLLDGVRPDDVLIALRDWERYELFFRIYQREYDLPLLMTYGTPIMKNPAITVLMNALRLAGQHPDAPTAFKRRDLLDVLRSPYVEAAGLDAEAVDLLDRVSRHKQIIGGRQQWLDSLEDASIPVYDHENDEEYPALITTAQYSALSSDLETFFHAVTLPEQDTVRGYVRRLDELIGQDEMMSDEDRAEQRAFDERTKHTAEPPYTLDMPQCIRSVSGAVEGEQILNRDITALEQFKSILRGMIQTEDFLQASVGQPPREINRAAFLNELEASINNATTVNRNPGRSGRVLVTRATDARGLPHDHVYVLGLSETIFPAEVPEDPLHLPGEIRALREHGVYLQTPEERSDDNGIFYELVRLPSVRLILSRPTVRDGKPWVESHLWRLVRSAFENLVPRKYAIGAVVPPDEVASQQEAVLTVADYLSRGEIEAVQAMRAWLHADDTLRAYWQHIQRGRAADAERLSQRPHTTYSGQLANPDLIAQAADTLGANHLWSATQLNDFGMCGYRYFAKRLLQLDALDEPDAGLDALQLGSLNHAILEHTYRQVQHDGLEIAPENQAEALDILRESAGTILSDAEEMYGFRATALWQEEQAVLKRRLEALVEIDFSLESPIGKKYASQQRRPFRLEWRFGMGNQPLSIPLASGERIRVRGSIDRVDILDESRLLVIDYKTGSSSIYHADMRAGRNFQMMVYLLALRELIAAEELDYDIAGGLFFHIRNQKTSGELVVDDQLAALDEIQMGKEHAADYLAQGREGRFVVEPTTVDNGRCASYCDYYQLCRLAVTNQHKQGH